MLNAVSTVPFFQAVLEFAKILFRNLAVMVAKAVSQA